jgi:DNA topoisomerase-1
MKLVIVESPTKAKTIAKFIDKSYKVESSYGHIRDLPEKKLGVDIENNFEPTYTIPAKAQKTVATLTALAAKADEVILASDEDREGEAIAWHLTQALDLDPGETKRIVFHEITKDAILHALETPRYLNTNLVDAQQARRVLDRLVGYELSPFLWKKVAKGLSAGRVQSVAVRLVVEREREIQAHNSEEYWFIDADLDKSDEHFAARLHRASGKVIDKMEIKNKEEADKILVEVTDKKFVVASVDKKEGKKAAPTPFTTSTLQQAANRVLGMSAKQTMTLAQKLYEQGHITYMRTDSQNLSDKFLQEAHDYLKTTLGQDYCLATPRKFKTKSKGAQEAHEAIRPTEVSQTPELLSKLDPGQLRLYRLIWQRSLASQMPDARVDNTTIDIDAINTIYQFRSTGQILTFPGYLKVYLEKTQDVILPNLAIGDDLNINSITPQQHFTKPPARYSDAGLVKVMERYGIGRPSTYAPTIATIEARNYVERDDDKKLKPTDIAFVVNDLLVKHFPNIVDYAFTAEMEKNFDHIADGSKKWQPVIGDFFHPFRDLLKIKTEEVQRADILPVEESTEVCDKCGSAMIIKTGRFGKYLACSNYPTCKNIKSLKKKEDETPEKQAARLALEEKYKDEKCDKCGEAMIIKTGRFGPFLGCSGYPKCKNIKGFDSPESLTGIKCPNCDKGEIVAKRSRRGVFYACNNYPECKTSFSSKPTGEKCPECKSLLIEGRDGGVKCSAKGCKFTKEA